MIIQKILNNNVIVSTDENNHGLRVFRFVDRVRKIVNINLMKKQ